MLWNAKNETVCFNDKEMNYAKFGSGGKTLILIPGLGDGLTTVKGKAVFLAYSYRKFTKDYTVYVFSRANQLSPKTSTRQMATELAEAMKILELEKADVCGISQGGMIAQYLAIDHPEIVNKLVLGVTLAQQNEMVDQVVNQWIEMAQRNDYKSLIIDTAEKSYSEKTLKKYRMMYPILTKFGQPQNFERFLIQANSCLNHNSINELHKIKCPTLILGGQNDLIVGVKASIELNEKIQGSELLIFDGLGHAAYEETESFNDKILSFLIEK